MKSRPRVGFSSICAASTARFAVSDPAWVDQGNSLADRFSDDVFHIHRSSDRKPTRLAARFGGEEFVVVLPDTRLEVASDLAEQRRNALLTARMTHEASPMHQVVTASFGVGCVVPLPQMSVAMFIDFVDAQLYSAKKNGRNRVSSARVSQFIASERVQS
jgi:diguanylate cyclase (GGDEF)-like protein